MSEADDQEPLLPPDEERELLDQLQAALRPGALDPRAQERLLSLALEEEPFAPPSEAELVESQRLRDALADAEPHPDADLLRALGAPFATADAEAVERALAAAERAPHPVERRSNVVYALFGAAGAALAAAAAIALLIGAPAAEPTASATAAPELVPARSTVELFDARFETSGTTERMDRIASARSRDLRDNRYAAWGVR